MPSSLIITPVNSLQAEIARLAKGFKDVPGIYVSLNKTQKSSKKFLDNAGVNVKKFFFIDCVSSKSESENTLHVPPENLDMLASALSDFTKEIPGKKFIIVDSLATILIYNDENKVARFVKKITELASEEEVTLAAFSPQTKSEELLTKIFNFFDKVQKYQMKLYLMQ